MQKRDYLDEGAVFTPEVITRMGEAFTGAAFDLGIQPDDETRREAIAQLICELAKAEPEATSETLRQKVVKILRGLEVGY
jgi:hypothetical protein